jgi:hypothetical protein
MHLKAALQLCKNNRRYVCKRNSDKKNSDGTDYFEVRDRKTDCLIMDPADLPKSRTRSPNPSVKKWNQEMEKQKEAVLAEARIKGIKPNLGNQEVGAKPEEKFPPRRIKEDISGSRLDNERTRARNWSDIRRRNKET